jgi:hypothetical protein
MKTPSRQFKDAIYEQFSRIGKAVESPKRLEMPDLLCQGAKTEPVASRERSTFAWSPLGYRSGKTKTFLLDQTQQD